MCRTGFFLVFMEKTLDVAEAGSSSYVNSSR